MHPYHLDSETDAMADELQDLDFTEYKARLLTEQLRRHIEGEIRFDRTSRLLYSTDASIYQIQPLGVVIPKTTDDLQTTVQIAAEMRIPITARGGGTSLSGQSIGPGVVIDCSKYLHRILDLDAAGRRARVQPGVVLDQLNQALLPHRLQFGPDVATASRANLGGMIGNNSAGAHSIVHGKTIDHVNSLRVLLSDGAWADFGVVSSEEWKTKAAQRSLEGAIYREIQQIVHVNAGEIRRRFPKILRRVSGYNLDLFAGGSSFSGADSDAGLHQLVVGGEGTLAVVGEAELRLVERPKAVGLLIPHFDSLAAALQALAVCLEHQPSAVELLDGMLIELAQNNLSLRNTMAAIHGKPACLLMVEISAENEKEVAGRVEKLRQRLTPLPGVSAVLPALEAKQRIPLWNLRRAAMPLLLGLPGDRKPVTFVEDAAVPPERLPQFVAQFQEILRCHDATGAFYGHASVGCLHIRPMLNLKEEREVRKMRKITKDVTDLVLAYGGSLSGEHGDGLARSEWNRKMFGDTIYGAFCRVKQAFDPDNILNPGKIVHAPPMTDNLRYGAGYHPVQPTTAFDYSRQEGFVRSIELCNGSGVCRRLQPGTMCPSFRATLEEKHSTRGRANALRLALAGKQPLQDLRNKWLYDVLDLCLMCKACKSECPSNVDMAKLKAEFLDGYYRGRVRPPGQYLMARIYRWYALGAKMAPLVNWLSQKWWFRAMMEMVGQIDRRRSLPPLRGDHFRRWFARHEPAPAAGTVGTVLLLDDCFTTYNDPEIGQAAVQVLEAAGYRIELARLTCCCRPMISKGFLLPARDLVHQQAPELARRIRSGIPILGLEPSCLLTLADEWPELVPNRTTRTVAASARLADEWLAEQIEQQRCQLNLRPRPEKCVVHGHCHQKALVGAAGTVSLLQRVPELQVRLLETGCCGMAGSFGYEKEHFEISRKVAEVDLLPQLSDHEDSLLAAPGTSCRHQIRDFAQRRAWHPMEILAQQVAQ